VDFFQTSLFNQQGGNGNALFIAGEGEGGEEKERKERELAMGQPLTFYTNDWLGQGFPFY